MENDFANGKKTYNFRNSQKIIYSDSFKRHFFLKILLYKKCELLNRNVEF